MNAKEILSDSELLDALSDTAMSKQAAAGYPSPGALIGLARAVIAAYEAKLAQQEPVAWRLRNTAFRGEVYEYFKTRFLAECRQMQFNASCDDGGLHDLTPLYTHPAPQQAARQRVPDGWKLVPMEPTPEMMVAAQEADMDHGDHDEWLEYDGGDVKRIHRAMLAAAPEAPAQASGYGPKMMPQVSGFDWPIPQTEPGVFRGTLRLSLDHPNSPAQASAVDEPTSYSHLAEQVSRLMTIGGATITERQQDVLAAALKALEVGMPTRYPITPERVTPDMRTDDEKLADLRGNQPQANYEHKKPDDTEGGAL